MTTPIRTIRDEWNAYVELVIPPAASEEQHRECRRAFYAGAEAFARFAERLGERDITEARGVRLLEDARDELRRFAGDVAAGRA